MFGSLISEQILRFGGLFKAIIVKMTIVNIYIECLLCASTMSAHGIANPLNWIFFSPFLQMKELRLRKLTLD